MLSYSALYYPFIHFRSEAWLKATALYWDRIVRIVPNEDQPKDSKLVNVLKEQGVVANHVPTDERTTVGVRFQTFLKRNRTELRLTYGIQESRYWTPKTNVWTERVDDNDDGLAYIFAPKLSSALIAQLVDAELAVIASKDRVGVHPDLAQVYMSSLASEVAANGKALYPISDSPELHLSPNCTLTRLAQALLRDVKLASSNPSVDEIECEMASCAIETVLPMNVRAIPIEAILRVRSDFADERAAFQTSIRDLVTKLDWLQQITDATERSQHINEQYEKHVAPRMKELKKILRLNKIGTTTGAMAVTTAAPTSIAGILLGAGTVGVLAGGIALGLVSLIVKNRVEYRTKVKTTPQSYLMRVEDELKPATLFRRIQRSARRFTYDE